MSTQPKRTPWLWPILLMIGGVVLLLDNFLLIDVNLAAYWPALLVLLGLQVLWRGDIAPSWQAHTFGITRGSVQSGSIEIESGELDVQLRALRKPGRLIAGEYTARSRPNLSVRNNHATLRMQRGQTWWLSLADWDVGLANDLPWGILVSSFLGRLEVDLRGLVVDRAYVSSGFGDVNLTCPDEARDTVFARSTFGEVRLTLPQHSRITITVKPSSFGRVRLNPARFRQIGPGVYTTAEDGESPDLNIVAGTVFGTISLS